MEKLANFLREVRVELAKVSWPTKQQTIVYTLTVLGVSLFLAFVLGVLDIFYEFLVNKFLIK